MEAKAEPLILIVDDAPDTLTLCSSALRRAGYRTICALDGRTALDLARDHLPDLVLSDVMMPGLDGYELVRRLRECARTSATCVILMTGSKVAEEDIVRGFECGVDDYILKPLRLNELTARVTAIIRGARRRRDISPLTGLPGNRIIQERLAQLLESGQDFSVLLLDIDNFKAFNDRYGFTRGDAAIRLLGHVLLDSALDVGDEHLFLGHIGGDDFIVITQGIDEEAFAGKVLQRFHEQTPALYDDLDRERGYVELEDRRGGLAHYPLMTLSIAGVSTANRSFSSPLELTEVLAEVKGFVKRSCGGRFHMDRRKQ
jgi:diguanylate cyclase (GGDEF)-like protein